MSTNLFGFTENLKAWKQQREQEKQKEQTLAAFTAAAAQQPLDFYHRAMTLSSPRAAPLQSPRKKSIIRLFGDDDSEEEDEEWNGLGVNGLHIYIISPTN